MHVNLHSVILTPMGPSHDLTQAATSLLPSSAFPPLCAKASIWCLALPLSLSLSVCVHGPGHVNAHKQVDNPRTSLSCGKSIGSLSFSLPADHFCSHSPWILTPHCLVFAWLHSSFHMTTLIVLARPKLPPAMLEQSVSLLVPDSFGHKPSSALPLTCSCLLFG